VVSNSAVRVECSVRRREWHTWRWSVLLLLGQIAVAVVPLRSTGGNNVLLVRILRGVAIRWSGGVVSNVGERCSPWHVRMIQRLWLFKPLIVWLLLFMAIQFLH